MTAEEIYKSHPWFQLYPLKNFKTNIKTLQKASAKLKKIVREDEKEIWSELIAFPRSELTCRGYPFWHIHPAQKLLEKDVKEGKADRMKPKELWSTQAEYQKFPELVFCHHVHQEKRRQNEERGMIVKRNKKGRKMHEKEAGANKESWDNMQINQDINNLITQWEKMGKK